MNRERSGAGSWGQEIDDLLRGLTGGFLVGIPLIYTMETWWIGETVTMPRALVYLLVAYVVNLAFVTVVGFRGPSPSARHPLTEALESTGIAVVATAVILTLLNQIRPDSSLDVIVGRIAVDMLPISLGISVAHIILAPRETRLGDDESSDPSSTETAQRVTSNALLLDVGAAFAGALFLGISIAPTEEIPMLATEIPIHYVPLVILFSLALTYAIVFEAGFGGRERRRSTPGLFQRPITETVLAYLTSLLVCAGLLALFGQIDLSDDWFAAFTQIVVLGLPAAIGAAAGRLAV